MSPVALITILYLGVKTVYDSLANLGFEDSEIRYQIAADKMLLAEALIQGHPLCECSRSKTKRIHRR